MAKTLSKSKSKVLSEVKHDPPRLVLEHRCDEDGERLLIDWAGEVDRICEAAPNIHVISHLAGELANLGSRGNPVDEKATNFAMGFIDTMKPQDPAELLLCTQMAATHQAVMMMARKLNFVDTIQQQDSAERALNKLMRTYTTQMETLKRYRTKGQQLVRVERVTVEDGGQAIVGNVQHGGGGDEKT